VGEHAQGFGHDFGPNVVSGKNSELECRHRKRIRRIDPGRRREGEFSPLHGGGFWLD
jgi:hypothetical protein